MPVIRKKMGSKYSWIGKLLKNNEREMEGAGNFVLKSVLRI